MKEFDMNAPLRDAKTLMAEKIIDGTQCPCCTQHAQIYTYRLYATSAMALIKLYNLDKFNDAGEFHVKDFAEATGLHPRASHFAELRFWELVQKSDRKADKTQKSSGYWSITDKGKAFVEGRIKVKESIRIFNNDFYGFSGDPITIEQALGNKFDYQQAMNGTFKQIK